MHRYLWAGLLAVVLMAGGTAIAAAEPENPSVDCTYELSPPHVVSVSGKAMVSVVVNPIGCTGLASPNFASACVSLAGDAGDGECANTTGYRAARVVYPHEPGRTYVARGRGCAGAFQPNAQVCKALGPVSAQL